MKTHHQVLIACALGLLVGCSGAKFDVPGEQDSGDTGFSETGDDSGGPDATVGDTNAVDSGTSDTGSPTDSGASDSTTPDSGTPDSWTPSDSGAADSASIDSDAADTGAPIDSGTLDTGTVDTGPACPSPTKWCSGTQPMTCDTSTGMSSKNGGACGYGCDVTTGLCLCQTTGRFAIKTLGSVGFGPVISYLEDALTGKQWVLNPMGGTSAPYPTSGPGISWSSSFHTPTVDELNNLLAQLGPNTSCPGFDGDPIFQTFRLIAGPYWVNPGTTAPPTAIDLVTGNILVGGLASPAYNVWVGHF